MISKRSKRFSRDKNSNYTDLTFTNQESVDREAPNSDQMIKGKASCAGAIFFSTGAFASLRISSSSQRIYCRWMWRFSIAAMQRFANRLRVIRPPFAHDARHLDVGRRIVAKKRIAGQGPDIALLFTRRNSSYSDRLRVHSNRSPCAKPWIKWVSSWPMVW